MENVRIIGDYEIYMNKKLGHGSYGEVYLARNAKEKNEVACKLIKKDTTEKDMEKI